MVGCHHLLNGNDFEQTLTAKDRPLLCKLLMEYYL